MYVQVPIYQIYNMYLALYQSLQVSANFTGELNIGYSKGRLLYAQVHFESLVSHGMAFTHGWMTDTTAKPRPQPVHNITVSAWQHQQFFCF